MRLFLACAVAVLGGIAGVSPGCAGRPGHDRQDGRAASANDGVRWSRSLRYGLRDAAGLPPDDLGAIVDEAGAIWARLGVRLVRVDEDAAVLRGQLPFDVRILVLPGAIPASPERAVVESVGSGGPALGSIPFVRPCVPARTIQVSVANTRRLLADGAGPDPEPRASGRSRLATALGRVVAHELGHYLLRTPRHANDGLMRRTFAGPDLSLPARCDFGLEARQIDVLAGRRGPDCP